MQVSEAADPIVTLIIYPFGILVSKMCIIIIITCLGLADASWPQPEDDFAVSMGTVEEMVVCLAHSSSSEEHPCQVRGNRTFLDKYQS